MKDSALKNILVNFRTAFSTNVRKRINDNARRIALLEETVAGLDRQMEEKYHYLNLLEYYASHPEEVDSYRKELDFMCRLGHYCIFPYPADKEPVEVASGCDSESGLVYVVHQGKKLFFPSSVSEQEAVMSYLNYIQTEKLLGVAEAEGAPHRYQSSNVCVEEGDVVFDIGAAEGLFALDQIDKASHVVVVERDPLWMEPLRHTFAPFGDKVTVIEKYISAVDTENTMSLEKLLIDTDYRSAFVKMDVEGCELPSVNSALKVLEEKRGTKLSVATYHHQHDAEELKALFEGIGYATEFSKGFMLFHLYDTPVPPYFRHGIIRAKHTGL